MYFNVRIICKTNFRELEKSCETIKKYFSQMSSLLLFSENKLSQIGEDIQPKRNAQFFKSLSNF